MIPPKVVDERILSLVKKIGIEETPFFIDINPEQYATVNNCFNNVLEKIKIDGGERVLGRQIWDYGFLVDAEFHAVWKSPNGEFVDITPKQIPTKRILFLPDLKATYDLKQVENIVLKTSDNPLVDDFIELNKTKFRIMNKGERAGQQVVRPTTQELNALILIEKLIPVVYTMLKSDLTRTSRCPCNKGKPYDHCHGKDLIRNLQTYG